MKNTWKWIIGIVIILVVVAGLVGLGLMARNNMLARQAAVFSARATAMSAQGKVVPQSTPGPQTKPQTAPPNGFMRRGFPGFGGPARPYMMPRGGNGFNRFGGGPGFARGGSFGPGAFIFGALARLVLFGLFILLLIGAFWLGRKSRAPAPVAAPVAPVATHTCPKCGSSVTDEAKYCPTCGKKQ